MEEQGHKTAKQGLGWNISIVFTVQILHEVFYRQFGPSRPWFARFSAAWCSVLFFWGLGSVFWERWGHRTPRWGWKTRKQRGAGTAWLGENAGTRIAKANTLFPEQRVWWRQLSWRCVPTDRPQVTLLSRTIFPHPWFSLCPVNFSPFWQHWGRAGAKQQVGGDGSGGNGVDGKVPIYIQIEFFLLNPSHFPKYFRNTSCESTLPLLPVLKGSCWVQKLLTAVEERVKVWPVHKMKIHISCFGEKDRFVYFYFFLPLCKHNATSWNKSRTWLMPVSSLALVFGVGFTSPSFSHLLMEQLTLGSFSG